MSACFIQFLQNTLEGDCFVSIKENPVKLNLHSPTSENSGNFLIHLPFITSSPGFRSYEVTVMTVISLILWEKSLTPLALPPSQVQSLVRDWVLVCPEEDFQDGGECCSSVQPAFSRQIICWSSARGFLRKVIYPFNFAAYLSV